MKQIATVQLQSSGPNYRHEIETGHGHRLLADEQWQKLLAIADKTPVTLTVKNGAAIDTRRIWLSERPVVALWPTRSRSQFMPAGRRSPARP